jgi:bifunctional non-homologous end joining protein LigD
MVWDAGQYHGLGSDPQKDLAEGKFHFALRGKKLEGEWTLVRLAAGGGKDWLLIKSGEDLKPVSKKQDNESSLTGRTMASIARARDAEWPSNRSDPAKAGRRTKLKFVDPMKATLVTKPPSDGKWLYELKFDGYRALALKSGAEVQLLSRNEKDFTPRFPEIAEAVARLKASEAIFDGEIVAVGEDGRPSFRLLQGLQTGEIRPLLAYYIFDLLRHNGDDLVHEPLEVRRERLRELLEKAEDPIRFSASLCANAESLLAEVRKRGLEGVIGKEVGSRYEAGRRSRSWIKLKCLQEQELVIGGFTPPAGTRKYFGALLVGFYEKKRLRFAGKVGTGFNEALLKSLHHAMEALRQAECPFTGLPERVQGRWSQNISPQEMKRCHWVAPRLVCQVRFTEWTEDGKLRHPAFVGLREDKEAREVIRERAE